MSDLSYLVRGAAFGFSIALPVGPIGLLVIRRALTHGGTVGFVSGLGAATADGVYGAVAAFGVSVVSSFLVSQSTWIRLVGGLFLCYLAVNILFSRPEPRELRPDNQGLAGAFASTAILTLANPATILSFAAVFTSLGMGSTSVSRLPAMLLVLGVFLGSACWWLLLSFAVGSARRQLGRRTLVRLNWLSGLVIGLFGVISIASVIGLSA